MKYLAKTKIQYITENTILTPEGFGGWSAVNEGDTPATVNGIAISPSGTIIGIDFTQLSPEVEWSEDIVIRFDPDPQYTTPKIVITRLKYTEV